MMISNEWQDDGFLRARKAVPSLVKTRYQLNEFIELVTGKNCELIAVLISTSEWADREFKTRIYQLQKRVYVDLIPSILQKVPVLLPYGAYGWVMLGWRLVMVKS